MKKSNYSSMVLAASFVLGLTFSANAQEQQRTDLDYIVPSDARFSDRAKIVSVDNARKVTSDYVIFSYFIPDFEPSNPIVFDKESIDILLSKTGSLYDLLEGATSMSLGFYNSQDYSLDKGDSRGVFIVEGVTFTENQRALDHKDFLNQQQYCHVILDKGSNVGFLYMAADDSIAPPTKAMWDLVDYAVANGFTSTVSPECPERQSN